jgi:hypothetical protein
MTPTRCRRTGGRWSHGPSGRPRRAFARHELLDPQLRPARRLAVAGRRGRARPRGSRRDATTPSASGAWSRHAAQRPQGSSRRASQLRSAAYQRATARRPTPSGPASSSVRGAASLARRERRRAASAASWPSGTQAHRPRSSRSPRRGYPARAPRAGHGGDVVRHPVHREAAVSGSKSAYAAAGSPSRGWPTAPGLRKARARGGTGTSSSGPGSRPSATARRRGRPTTGRRWRARWRCARSRPRPRRGRPGGAPPRRPPTSPPWRGRRSRRPRGRRATRRGSPRGARRGRAPSGGRRPRSGTGSTRRGRPRRSRRRTRGDRRRATRRRARGRCRGRRRTPDSASDPHDTPPPRASGIGRACVGAPRGGC